MVLVVAYSFVDVQDCFFLWRHGKQFNRHIFSNLSLVCCVCDQCCVNYLSILVFWSEVTDNWCRQCILFSLWML